MIAVATPKLLRGKTLLLHSSDTRSTFHTVSSLLSVTFVRCEERVLVPEDITRSLCFKRSRAGRIRLLDSVDYILCLQHNGDPSLEF